MRSLVAERGLDDRVVIDSAGTAGYHVGSPPDPRSVAEAARNGISIADQRSRQFHVGDFAFFDLVVAMDDSNFADLVDLAPDDETASLVTRLRQFDPAAPSDLDVPDPYYHDGFDGVFRIIDHACRGLLLHVEQILVP